MNTSRAGNEALPEGWQVKKLVSTAINTVNGFTDGDWIETPFIADKGIRLIQTGNIGLGRFLNNPESTRFVSMQTFQQLGCKWTYPGDILICRLADPVGRACMVPEEVGPSITAVDCTIYRPSSEVADSHFMVQSLNSEKHLRQTALLSAGTTRQRISRSNLGAVEILVPPLPEQRRIAEILDAVDRNITKTEQLIEKLRAIKSGFLHDLLTRGIGEDGRVRNPEKNPEKFRDSRCGLVPISWNVKCIGEICRVTKLAGFEFTEIMKYEENGEIIALRALNIKEEKLDLTNIQRISQVTSDSLPRSKVMNGDVLITYIGAYIGDILLIEKSNKYHLAPNIARISSGETIAPTYLEWALRGQLVQTQIRALTAVTATPSLTMTQIRIIALPVPPIPEQTSIAGSMIRVAERIAVEESYLSKLKNIKQGMMSNLLTGQVRVPISKEEREGS